MITAIAVSLQNKAMYPKIMAKKTGTVKKKVVKVGAVGMAYVHSTFNNVIILSLIHI